MLNWIQRFLTHLRAGRNYSDHTLRAYAADLRQFSRLGGCSEPADISRNAVRAYLARLQSDGRKGRGTVLRAASALRAFFKYLRAEGAMKTDPFCALPLPRKAVRLPKFLTESEMSELLDRGGASDPQYKERDRAIFELLYSCGLRRAELCGLNVGDVDFVSGFVRVLGKGSRERLVPVGAAALSALRGYLRGRGPSGGRGESPLFVNARGERLGDSGVAYLLKGWRLRAGSLKPVTPHVFRHSCATHLLNAGCDLRSVQEMLGHQSLATTQLYTHVSLEKLKQVYRKSHPRGGAPQARHPGRPPAGGAHSVGGQI